MDNDKNAILIRGAKIYKLFFLITDSATIQDITSSVAKSWIGQTVKLKCLVDGGPIPTVTWIKPNRRQLNSVISRENTVNVTMTNDEDFGLYTCNADNGFGPSANQTIQVQQISKRTMKRLFFA